jgi:Arc/MetJ-type ribon-helix-helix transcriptional regulator
MVRAVVERHNETEKITVNIGFVDLGRVDLLVTEGFYSNRADFIRTAIRNQLGTHEDALARSLRRQTLDLGLRTIDRAELEAARAAGSTLDIKVVGLVRIASDVTPALAREAISSLTVLGALQAPQDVKNALSDRIR